MSLTLINSLGSKLVYNYETEQNVDVSLETKNLGSMDSVIIFNYVGPRSSIDIELEPGIYAGQNITIINNSAELLIEMQNTASSIVNNFIDWLGTATFTWTGSYWVIVNSSGKIDGTDVFFPAFSDKWNSAMFGTTLQGGFMLTYGSMQTLADNNDDPMGIFPPGTRGTFSLRVEALLSPSSGAPATLQNVDIGTSDTIFGSTPTFYLDDTGSGNFAYMNMLYKLTLT